MTVKVVHVKHRGGAPAKRVIDLTKTAPRPLAKMKPKPPEAKPEPKQQQPRRLHIEPAPDGPPIAPDLPEGHRQMGGGPIKNPLHDKQIEILDQIVEMAGQGDPRTLGLRLVVAAAEHRYAAAWPIGLLSKALRLSGRPTEAQAVHGVAMGCRTSRYGQMAANALMLLNQKIEAEASS